MITHRVRPLFKQTFSIAKLNMRRWKKSSKRGERDTSLQHSGFKIDYAYMVATHLAQENTSYWLPNRKTATAMKVWIINRIFPSTESHAMRYYQARL